MNYRRPLQLMLSSVLILLVPSCGSGRHGQEARAQMAAQSEPPPKSSD